MGQEFPVTSNEPFLGSQTPVLGRGQDRSWTARLFRWIPYNAVGRFTGTLDYALIVAASIAAGVTYHSIVLQGNVPPLMPYLATGNIVAGLFVFGSAA